MLEGAQIKAKNIQSIFPMFEMLVDAGKPKFITRRAATGVIPINVSY